MSQVMEYIGLKTVGGGAPPFSETLRCCDEALKKKQVRPVQSAAGGVVPTCPAFNSPAARCSFGLFRSSHQAGEKGAGDDKPAAQSRAARGVLAGIQVTGDGGVERRIGGRRARAAAGQPTRQGAAAGGSAAAAGDDDARGNDGGGAANKRGRGGSAEPIMEHDDGGEAAGDDDDEAGPPSRHEAAGAKSREQQQGAGGAATAAGRGDDDQDEDRPLLQPSTSAPAFNFEDEDY